MHIAYRGQPPTKEIPGWPDVNEFRPLRTLTAGVAPLWDLARRVEVSVAANELERIEKEINAATWIRNTHAAYQVREFMVDFWNNHFAVGQQQDILTLAALPAYDGDVIRPRALGNFRDLLGAVARSAAMLMFLDNAASTASHPNENYAREIMELHTLGGSAYLGVDARRAPPPATVQGVTVAGGFNDADVIQVSRALSGWTLEQGQPGPDGLLPYTGRFVFNPLQHSTNAASVLGVDLSSLDGMAQGEKVLDLIAYHPATAAFLCTKLCRRIFGDNPPPSAVERAKTAWLDAREQPDQIRDVLGAIMMGPEMGLPPVKVRRPYERIIAFFRTTDTVVTAFDLANTAVAPLGDGIYVWPTPEGRPDVDSQWLTTPSNLYIWNLLLLLLLQPAIQSQLIVQTPRTAFDSAQALVEYWVGRMVGYRLRRSSMRALAGDEAEPWGSIAAYKTGGAANMENCLRRLVAMIASTPEFAMR
jgi:uncharacterized protein (DUF1800 family)